MEPQEVAGLELDRLARQLLAAHGCAEYVMTDASVSGVIHQVRDAGAPLLRQLVRWVGHGCGELARLAAQGNERFDLTVLADEAGEYGVPADLARQVVCCLHLMELPEELAGHELDDAIASLLASYGVSALLGTSGFFVLVAMRAAELDPAPSTHQQVMARWFVAEECSRCGD